MQATGPGASRSYTGLLTRAEIERFQGDRAGLLYDEGDDDDEVSIPDKRRRIEKTKVAPWRCIGRLIGKFPDGKPMAGTGVLVGRAHVLTAAHNLYDARKGGYAAQLEFRPGEYAAQVPLPFGSATSQELWVPDAYKAAATLENDFGIILLTYAFGDELGWLGILPAQDSFFPRRQFEMTEFPNDKDKGELWSSPGRVRRLQPDRFEHSMSSDVRRGSGIVWTEVEASQLVVGIHIDLRQGSRRAVRLNETKYAEITEVIERMEPDSG